MKKRVFEITIVADTNDADYVTSINKINEDELELIKPLIKAIKNFKPYSAKSASNSNWSHSHNYPHGDGDYIPRKDLGEKTVREIYPNISEAAHSFFADIVPYGEHGIHTIESIEITPYVKKQKLL